MCCSGLRWSKADTFTLAHHTCVTTLAVLGTKSVLGESKGIFQTHLFTSINERNLSDTVEENALFCKLISFTEKTKKGLLMRKLEFLIVHKNINSLDPEM